MSHGFGTRQEWELSFETNGHSTLSCCNLIILLISDVVGDGLPDDIAELLKQGEVVTTYHMSLGFDDGFIISYKDKRRNEQTQ